MTKESTFLEANPLNQNKALVLSILVLSVFFMSFNQTIDYLAKFWIQFESGEYSHGFIVLLIATMMLWGKREEMRSTEKRPVPAMLALIVLLSLSATMAILLDIKIIESLAFYSLLLAIVITLHGWQFFKVIRFPLFYLLIALPVWAPILPTLQTIASVISFELLKLTGISIYREGNYLIVTSGDFHVEKGCSGLRYLLGSMTFSGFYIYLENLKKWRALAFFLMVVATAILANVLRVVLVVYMGEKTAMQHPWVHDHLSLGWYIFAVMLIPVFFLGSRLVKDIAEKEHLSKSDVVSARPHNNDLLILPFILLAVLSGTGFKYWLDQQVEREGSHKGIKVNLNHEHWKLQQHLLSSIGSQFLNNDEQYEQQYVSEKQAVNIFIATYYSQEDGKELININNYLYDKNRWKTVEYKGNSNQENVNERLIKNTNDQEYLLQYCYHVAGLKTASEFEAKLYQLYGLLTGNSSASVIIVSTPVTDDLKQSRMKLKKFTEALEYL